MMEAIYVMNGNGMAVIGVISYNFLWVNEARPIA